MVINTCIDLLSLLLFAAVRHAGPSVLGGWLHGRQEFFPALPSFAVGFNGAVKRRVGIVDYIDAGLWICATDLLRVNGIHGL